MSWPGRKSLTMRELNARDRRRWPASRPDLVDVPDFVAAGIADARLPARRAADPRPVADASEGQCAERQAARASRRSGSRPTPLARRRARMARPLPQGRPLRARRESRRPDKPCRSSCWSSSSASSRASPNICRSRSTGHLILATELLGFKADQWALFNVAIQPGAILAILVLYWRTFRDVLIGLWQREPSRLRLRPQPARRLHSGGGASASPSATMIELLLGNAVVVAWALIIGGFAILLVERLGQADRSRRRRQRHLAAIRSASAWSSAWR